MPGAPAFDGHEELRGVWGGAPGSVPKGYAQQSGNRFFREDYNRTRPAINNINLVFESETQRIWFQGANGQGATFYQSWPSYLTPKLVVSIGGRIFTIEIQGRNGIVRQLFDGNSRQFMHAWFGQGFQYLVIQDGISAPIIWDGSNPATRSNIVTKQVPIGSCMAFIHGRFVVASADGKNSIYVGDIAYGSNVTTPADILNFTEHEYWAEGGSFDAPTNIGDIMGLQPMPFLDTGTGQNELVVGGRFGFTSLDLSGPRNTWINTQVQRVSLLGQGLVSSHGYDTLNGDMFFRSQQGISTYRNARIQYSQGWRQAPVSREVNYWIQNDRKDLLEFIPMVSWQNMVFTGCSPLWERPNNPNFGYHRFCRGMTVFDADAMSTAGRDGTPVWHGMWSGVRPWAFAQGIIQNQERCFVFSFDRDGRNRLYELSLQAGDDAFENTLRKQRSFYTTGEFGIVEARTNAFSPKKLTGGVLELNEILGATEFTVEYKPDGSPCWVQVATGEPGCACPTRGDCVDMTAAPQWARKYFESIAPNICVPGSTQPASLFHHCQVKVSGYGSFQVERMNIRMDLQPDSQIAACLGNNCAPINCCPDADDYAYHIAPAGVNTEVPTPPEVGPTVYVATRLYTAICANYPATRVTAQGQAESTISQEDADVMAQQNAQQNAEDQLVCPQCEPNTEDDFMIDGGSEDLSAFFVSGSYTGNEGQPIRLYDVILDEYIASGIVNDSGTFEMFTTYPSYTHGSFDIPTSVYTDLGGGFTRIQLQLGCAIGGVQSWPVVGSYGL